MDADVIRLILLILGICLVVGIWLWDRWQRSQGEPPMVRMREEEEPLDEDSEPDWEEHEEAEVDADQPEWDEPDSELAAPTLKVDEDSEPLSDTTPDPVFDEAPSGEVLLREEEPEESAASGSIVRADARPPRSSWVEPKEPIIPAFLIRSESELQPEELPPLSDGPDVATADDAREVARPSANEAQPTEEPSLRVTPDDEPDLPVLELAPEPIDAPARPRVKKTKTPPPKPEAEPVAIRNDEDQFDLDLGFSAVDEQDLQDVSVDLPDLILQINIVARGEPFTGEQVLAAMDQVEMHAGEHDIFHRFDNRAAKGKKPKSLFSLASLVEPGSFPLKKMKAFSTPGLTLFAQLPGPRDGLLIYSDMLYVAERLARLLDARLKDENRSTLTKQTIEHTRERIAEHKRQITLKLRQASDRQRGRR